MSYSTYSSRNYRPPKQGRSKKPIVLFIVLLVLVVVGVVFFLRRDTATAPENNQASNTPVEQAQEPQKPALPDMQPLVDSWVSANSGTYSIVITDTDGKVVGSYNPDEEMFTASIYKLYVAYAGYQKIADGTYPADEAYAGGYTRIECLDQMIRNSFSPCAEVMWAELGKQNLTDQMAGYGLKNTNMVGLTSTAEDAAIMLQKIYAGQNLTAEHKALYLDSMKTQPDKYRRGLPSGFTTGTVYNKVGWNEDIEWHDTAIVEVNGKVAIVSVFSKGAGYKNIAGIGAEIQKALQ